MRVEIANRVIATASRIGNHENTDSNACDVNSTPWIPSALLYTPVIIITKAVMEQTKIVSIKGDKRDMKPVFKWLSLLAGAYAIGAEPIPDSFEKTALFTPAIIDPRSRPTVASTFMSPGLSKSSSIQYSWFTIVIMLTVVLTNFGGFSLSA